MDRLVLLFTYEKETKNMVRYQEVLGEVAHSSWDFACRTIYIEKECLGDPPPRRLKVTIEEDTSSKI